MTKFCGKCNRDRPDTLFNKRKLPSGNYTLQSWCKECSKANIKRWRTYKYKTDKTWAKSQAEKAKECRDNNPSFCEKVKERNKVRSKKHYRENKHRYLHKYSERRARKLQATPNWLTEGQKDQIRRIYKVREKVSVKTEVEHHVDHIVPLQGENVCGLHVPWNLRVIPKPLNLSKGNKHEWL